MRQNNISNWKYTKEISGLLFFAQRMDEVLFHHSTDTYRYPTLSINSLAREYISIHNDIKRGIVYGDSHLDNIIDEFDHLLKTDPIAQGVLTSYYTERFFKCHGQWNHRELYENMVYVCRQLGNKSYLNAIIHHLDKWILGNTEKANIQKYAAILVRELIDYGYDANYIYRCLHRVFFHESVDSHDSYQKFINYFSFDKKKYNVYVGYGIDVSYLLPLFKKLENDRISIELVDPRNVPLGIRTKHVKTLLLFSEVDALDEYSAYSIVENISSLIVNAHLFYRHLGEAVNSNGQVVDVNGNITRIRKTELLKYRVAAGSINESKENANRVLSTAFSTYQNFRNIPRLIEKHNAAIYSESTSDSLLSLWSVLESQIDNQSEELTDKFNPVSDYVIPFLKSTYIYKLTSTCASDIKHWDPVFFNDFIMSNGFGSNEVEHTFAFLAFKKEQSARDELYKNTEQFPLLRFRVYELSETFSNSKGIKRIINVHSDRVKWHLRRIYRSRNYIIHDGVQPAHCEELVENLHSYVDIVINKTIDLIDQSPYRDTVRDILISEKLEVTMMDEMLLQKENESIDESNALRYLEYSVQINSQNGINKPVEMTEGI